MVMDKAELYTAIPNKVIYCKNLTVYEKMVYFTLRSMCFGAKNQCFPSLESIAEILACSTRQVMRCTKRLEDVGLLTVKYRGLGQSNVYMLVDTLKWDQSVTERTVGLSV